MSAFMLEEPAMIIDFPTIDAGTRYPSPVFSQDTADLMDIHFPFSLFSPEQIYLMGDGERLFADDESVKILFNGAPETVIERLDGIGSRKPGIPDELLDPVLSPPVFPDRMVLPAGENIGGKTDDHPPLVTGQFERPGDEPLVTVVEGIEGSPDHNLHRSS
jgi:hypothetical protein